MEVIRQAALQLVNNQLELNMLLSEVQLIHAFSCPHGAFPTTRHNNVRDLTASLLSEVCHNVKIEPNLQPLTGEVLRYRTAVFDDDARFDIRAAGFWGTRQ